MIPYFDRFMARFPTLASLAAASEDQVTALWSGLGYYVRARNLRRAALAALANHGGELPRSEAELGELPGLGPYTAAAVAAIAFGARTFALDGNGARVISRLGGVTDSIDLPATRLRLRAGLRYHQIGVRFAFKRLRHQEFAQLVRRRHGRGQTDGGELRRQREQLR